ncbi:flagellar biosynthetic protein FliO [Cohnella nanjingensis]|uniref:Flagellar biosynthetic protein FliO n=1 Tax=Cohnella nanjingensis TaxID=1387779 RepID=A0A7X0RVU1_9BACL|nr:flagellar biosynthetic protein FliO [Cohnella nanjingensis]MBB6674607.1 flagellar biosynthetic protein FliO [Cohnella nanjingensis]
MSATWLASGYSGTSSWDLLWVLFVLVLMVGGIVLLLRFLGKRNRGWWMNRSLRSLGGLPLGTNKSMQIVEWNGRIYVLGVGDDVTLIESISDPDQVTALLAAHDVANAEARPGMPPWLRQWMNRRQPEGERGVSAPAAPPPSFEQTLENRMRELSERRQKVGQMLSDSRTEDRTEEP